MPSPAYELGLALDVCGIFSIADLLEHLRGGPLDLAELLESDMTRAAVADSESLLLHLQAVRDGASTQNYPMSRGDNPMRGNKPIMYIKASSLALGSYKWRSTP